nr:hypothetical protein [Tanacetum cinerariifolium]
MQTKIELTLEQSQQGVCNDVLINDVIMFNKDLKDWLIEVEQKLRLFVLIDRVILKVDRSVPRNVNLVNARNPPVRAGYECGSTDHGRRNHGNQARGRAFMLGAECWDQKSSRSYCCSVIKNGNKVLKKFVRTTVETYEPTSAEEKLDRRNEIKSRCTLLIVLPNKDQLKFHSYQYAKLLMEANKKRYGGNRESKKVQRTLLK